MRIILCAILLVEISAVSGCTGSGELDPSSQSGYRIVYMDAVTFSDHVVLVAEDANGDSLALVSTKLTATQSNALPGIYEPIRLGQIYQLSVSRPDPQPRLEIRGEPIPSYNIGDVFRWSDSNLQTEVYESDYIAGTFVRKTP